MLGSPSRARFATIPGLTLLVLAFVLLAETTWASSPPAEDPPEPSSADLALIRRQFAEARRALDKLGALAVPEADRKELARRIQAAAEAVSSYERLAERGRSRKRIQAPLLAAGAVVVADDATGIGAIDDVLLPVLALGLLATQLLTHGPPTASELGEAIHKMTAAMVAASEEAERVKKEAAERLKKEAAGSRAIPDRKNCQKHFERCQDSYLGKRNSGYMGASICFVCFDHCKKHGWPDFVGDKPCTWWEEWLQMPPEGQPQRKP